MKLWTRGAWIAIGVVAVTIGVLSLGDFLQARGAFAGWFTIGPTYKWALAQFRAEFLSRVLPSWAVPYLDGIAYYIALGIRSFLRIFDIHWSLRTDWKDIIVPLWLYFGRNALANRKANDTQIVTRAYAELSDAERERLPRLPILIDRARRGRRFFFWILLTWGLLAALLIATATGLTPVGGSSLLSLGWFLVFFVVYELGSNALVATLVPYVGERWSQSFHHHFRRTRQNIGLGASLSVLAVVFWLLPLENTDGVLALLIFLYIMTLGLRDCLNPIRDVWRDPTYSTFWEKWLRLQDRAQFQLGLSVLAVLFGVVVAVISKL